MNKIIYMLVFSAGWWLGYDACERVKDRAAKTERAAAVQATNTLLARQEGVFKKRLAAVTPRPRDLSAVTKCCSGGACMPCSVGP